MLTDVFNKTNDIVSENDTIQSINDKNNKNNVCLTTIGLSVIESFLMIFVLGF